MPSELYQHEPGQIDLNSTYLTSHGCEVKLIAVNPNGIVVGAYQYKNGYWEAHEWDSHGKSRTSSMFDLVQPRVHHTKWINIYRNRTGALQAGAIADTFEEVDRHNGMSDKVAIAKIEFFEGEGLDIKVHRTEKPKTKINTEGMAFHGTYQDCSLYTDHGKWYWIAPSGEPPLNMAMSRADALIQIDNAITEGRI